MDSQSAKASWRGWPIALWALGASAVVWGTMLLGTRGKLNPTLGDTDDALRLVFVRALAHGEAGWWDQHFMRLQPPEGVYMHWSRLVDGGIAAVMRLFELFVPQAQAETLTRFAWPMLWVLPAAWATLMIARRLGGVPALLPAAGFLAFNPMLYTQWWPGRIDHHNIQITSVLLALLGALQAGVAGGVLAGAATSFGLAVGLEALPFMALIGAAIALAFLVDPERGAPAARAYALTLLVMATGLYAIQTPPHRWAVSACDVMQVNLWAALALAGAGLFAGVQFTRERSFAVRLIALGLAGALAGAVYVAIDPVCLKGPLGAVDPRIKPIWMNQVSEMRGLFEKVWPRRSFVLFASYFLCALGFISWFVIGRRREHRTPAWMLVGACFLTGFLLALDAERMVNYANWCAVPLVATALTRLLDRPGKSRVAIILVTALLSQHVQLPILDRIPGWKKPEDARPRGQLRKVDECIDGKAFAVLRAQPAGLVLGEVDLGPRILAQTPDSALAAPYHRMAFGILAAYRALSATPGQDEQEARRLGVDYVVTCPARHRQLNHHLGQASLQVRLDRGQPPGWLEPLSKPSDPLQVYRVRPPAGT
jgi:hypothetical protein